VFWWERQVGMKTRFARWFASQITSKN